MAGGGTVERACTGSISRIHFGKPIAILLLLVLFAAQGLVSYQTERFRRTIVNPGEHRGTTPQGLLWRISRHPAFTFGFRNVLADTAWLQAVQVSGSPRMSRADYDRLDFLLRIVGDLDSRFDVPFLLGGLILANSPDHVGAAIETFERGMRHHPQDWRLPFYIGYIRYFSLGDPIGSGKAIEEASRLPGSPPYLPLLASRMLSEGREPQTALKFLDGILRQETDAARIEILNKRIREVIVERDIQELEHAVEEFRRKRGAYPATLSDLVLSGTISRLPDEPNGGKYILGRDGTIRSNVVTTRLKVFRLQ